MTRTRITLDGLDPAVMTKANVGLANCDNTSDANKPVSTATQTALNALSAAKANAVHTHESTALTDSTAAGRALLTGADAAAQRTTLGLGTMATATAADYLARAGGTMTGAVAVTAGNAAAPGVAISGDTDTGITQAGGANTLSVATNGVERWRVGSDGATQSVIPGGSTLLPQFMCRAWVNFQGNPMAVRASGNVSSVVRNGVGDYTINLSTAMPDANSAVSMAYTSEVNVQHTVGFLAGSGITASSVRVGNFSTANGVNTADKSIFCLAVFR